MSVTENIVDIEQYKIKSEPYYEAVGDSAAAKDAAGEARRLAEAGGGGTLQVDPAPRTGRLL